MSNHPDTNPEYQALVGRVVQADAGYREILTPPADVPAVAYRKRISVQMNRKAAKPLAARGLRAMVKVVRQEGREVVLVQVAGGGLR
jgi:hypothetical protein